jgi:hypothetical protein
VDVNRRALVAIALATASCQTRTQALIVTIGAAGVGMGAGYFEYASRTDKSGPPYSLIVGGAVAAVSAISMLFLGERRRSVQEATPSDWEPSDHRDRAELMTAMRRTGCLGHCPQYSITIYRDGTVEYNGIADVARIGSVLARLSVPQLEALEARFVPAYESFDSSYSEVRCTDLPTVYTWYRPSGNSTRSVAHYLGDVSAPPALAEIERAIDDAVHIERWIGREHAASGPLATFCH